jgi:hypothetical protein
MVGLLYTLSINPWKLALPDLQSVTMLAEPSDDSS